MKILVTGGTGLLGRQVVTRLLELGHEVVVLSRQAGPKPQRSRLLSGYDETAPRAVDLSGSRIVKGDLATGEGLKEAVGGTEAIAHLATTPYKKAKQTDVEGTRRLVRAGLDARVSHLLFVSIVGVDRHPFPYYKRKYEAEQIIEQSRIGYTILRAPQFHELIFFALEKALRLPVLLLPKGSMFQVVDSGEVADHVVELTLQGPQGRARDFGGPAVRSIDELARAYMAKKGMAKPIVHFPMVGRSGKAFRAGLNTCPEDALGRITWEEYLDRVL